MRRSRKAELRGLFIDLDRRLLELATCAEPLDPDRPRHIAACETSRNAVKRLLAKAQAEPWRPRDRRAPMRSTLALLAVLSLSDAAHAGPDPGAGVAPATRGLFVALRKCAACHAVGPLGAGPDAEAPPFGTIRLRHDPASLRRRLGEIASIGHQKMPPIRLSAQEIEDVASYIETVAPPAASPPQASQVARRSSGRARLTEINATVRRTGLHGRRGDAP